MQTSTQSFIHFHYCNVLVLFFYYVWNNLVWNISTNLRLPYILKMDNNSVFSNPSPSLSFPPHKNQRCCCNNWSKCAGRSASFEQWNFSRRDFRFHEPEFVLRHHTMDNKLLNISCRRVAVLYSFEIGWVWRSVSGGG